MSLRMGLNRLSLCVLQVAVDKARALSLEGQQLIENRHYAVDSIHPKCDELQHLCDHFASEVTRRRGLLSKSLELHSLLETVGHPADLTGQPEHPFPHISSLSAQGLGPCALSVPLMIS